MAPAASTPRRKKASTATSRTRATRTSRPNGWHSIPWRCRRRRRSFAADARYIQEGPESTKTFLDLDKDLRDKLRDGINPSKGNGGTGKDGGTGSGKDKGVGTGTGEGTGRMLNEGEKRMLRWSMKFNTGNGADYLRQLTHSRHPGRARRPQRQFKVIRDLWRPHPPLLDEDLSQIQRIWWIDDNPRSVESLMAAMDYSNLWPLRVVAFIPPELEEELAKKTGLQRPERRPNLRNEVRRLRWRGEGLRRARDGPAEEVKAAAPGR